MKICGGIGFLFFSLATHAAFAQIPRIDPQILKAPELGGKVTKVEVAARFVTTIRLPEAVSSVVVGDPSKFQVEHSEREPKLVFVKTISMQPAETNLLISTVGGRQASVLLVSQGETIRAERTSVDFLVSYTPARDFLVAPSGFPFAMVGQTVPLERTASQALAKRLPDVNPESTGNPAASQGGVRDEGVEGALDKFLEEQERASLPVLYGGRVNAEFVEGDRVRAGVSRVIDGGDHIVVLFSVVNPTNQTILLMPPQVQLGGQATSGKFIRRKKWTTAEQLPVLDFRLSRRRVGPGDRADGVALLERPPYKQSNETLLLQIADAAAVDRPALVPIGFGVSTSSENGNDGGN